MSKLIISHNAKDSTIPQSTEAVAKTVRAYNKECIGCQKFKKDVMITVQSEDGGFHDYFLTEMQAEELSNELREKIDDNVRIGEIPNSHKIHEPIVIQTIVHPEYGSSKGSIDLREHTLAFTKWYSTLKYNQEYLNKVLLVINKGAAISQSDYYHYWLTKDETEAK